MFVDNIKRMAKSGIATMKEMGMKVGYKAPAMKKMAGKKGGRKK